MRTKNNNDSVQPVHQIKAFLLGTLFGIISLFILYFIFSAVVSAVDLSYPVLVGLTLMAMGISAFISGFFSAKMIGNKGMIVGAVSGIILSVFFLLISLCFFSSSFGLFTIIKVIIMIFIALCGGIFGVNSKKSHR